jgi:Fe-Mn family superoxide dismutase
MPLPYDHSALRPVMSAKTLEFHHGKHHKGYVDKLNKLIEGTPYERLSLEEIIRKAGSDKSATDKPGGDQQAKKIFNNAAQVWNHDFFWLSMKPEGGGEPQGDLRARIEQSFASLDKFGDTFVKEGVDHFGSGWVWLIAGDDGALKVISTHDAANPVSEGGRALLCCDLWEHAYYLDFQNDREGFLHDFLGRLVNWDRAAQLYRKTAQAA